MGQAIAFPAQPGTLASERNNLARIAVECRGESGQHIEKIERPTSTDLERLFAKLHGNTFDSLSLETADHGSLLIGGGPERFVAVRF